MSHIATIKTEIKDIEAVKDLCRERGWQFNEGATEYKGMGWTGQCAHSISGIKGCEYEIGLTRNDNGSYSLAFDDYFAKVIPSWNNGKTVVGKDAGAFLQGYGICKIEREAKSKGWLTTRQHVPNTNKIQVVLAGM